MKELLLSFAKYNLWANERINSILRNHPDVMDKELISSFKTIRLTIYHLWDAETIWYMRLAGESLTTWPSESFLGTEEDFFKAFNEQSQKLISLVESMQDEKFSESCHYTNTKGIEFKTKVSEIILHVMNHSTFHRGQIITMLRNCGISELPSTDYIAFIKR